MAYTDYLRPIVVGDTEGTKWAITQAWLHQAVINAGIAIPMSNPMLTDINVGDSEGTKWAKMGAWTELLAGNIASGGTSESGVDASINSWAQLAAIPTSGQPQPIVKVWVDSAVSPPKTRTTQTRAGTDATNTPAGIQRPNDYSASNQFVWYETS